MHRIEIIKINILNTRVWENISKTMKISVFFFISYFYKESKAFYKLFFTAFKMLEKQDAKYFISLFFCFFFCIKPIVQHHPLLLQIIVSIFFYLFWVYYEHYCPRQVRAKPCVHDRRAATGGRHVRSRVSARQLRVATQRNCCLIISTSPSVTGS